MIFELLDRLSTSGSGEKVEFVLPSECVISPLEVEKKLAQFGIRMYERSWDSAHSEDRTGEFSFKVRKSQFKWAYDILLASGWPVLSPKPPTKRLQAMSADRNFAMSKKPQTYWGRPVSNDGLVAFFTNMWRGDMSVGAPPVKEKSNNKKSQGARSFFEWLAGE